MGVFSAVFYLLDLFGFSFGRSPSSILVGIVMTILHLVVLAQFISGVEEMETRYETNLYATALRRCWIALLILHLVNLFAAWIPMFFTLCFLILLVVTICFLVSLHRTWKAFDGLRS